MAEESVLRRLVSSCCASASGKFEATGRLAANTIATDPGTSWRNPKVELRDILPSRSYETEVALPLVTGRLPGHRESPGARLLAGTGKVGVHPSVDHGYLGGI